MSRVALRSTESIPGVRRWPTPRSKAWTLQFLAEAMDNDNVMAIVAAGSAVRPEIGRASCRERVYVLV